MSGIRENARIEKLGNAIALWGGLLGLIIWLALLLLHGNVGLPEFFFLLGIPVVVGGVLRLASRFHGVGTE